jgi:hypothetical protein
MTKVPNQSIFISRTDHAAARVLQSRMTRQFELWAAVVDLLCASRFTASPLDTDVPGR